MKIYNFIIKSFMIIVLCFLLKSFIVNFISIVNPSLTQKSFITIFDSKESINYMDIYRKSVKECEDDYQCTCSSCQKSKAECLSDAEKVRKETASKLRRDALLDFFLSILNIAIWFLGWFLLDRLFSYIYHIDDNKSGNVKKAGSMLNFEGVNMEKIINYSISFAKIFGKLFFIAIICVLVKNVVVEGLNYIKPGVIGYEKYRYYNIEYLSDLKDCENDFNSGKCIEEVRQKRDINLEKARADIISSLLDSFISLLSVLLFVVLIKVVLKWNIIPSFNKGSKK